jgi:hypothetical protein
LNRPAAFDAHLILGKLAREHLHYSTLPYSSPNLERARSMKKLGQKFEKPGLKEEFS